MLVKDQIGRELNLSNPPQRIISLVPSITELLVDLGLEQQLCGVTKFCVHPGHIRKSKKVVGGTKSVHIDRIRALEPDLVICNKEENTSEMVAELEQICPVWVSDIASLKDTAEMITEIGSICQKSDEAESILESLLDFQKEIKQRSERFSSTSVIYLIWKKPLMAAGNGTFIHHMLELCNLKNCVNTSRYPEVGLEELRAADIILLSSEPYPFKQEDLDLLESESGKPCVLVDGEFFSWYGTRILEGTDYLRTFRERIGSILS